MYSVVWYLFLSFKITCNGLKAVFLGVVLLFNDFDTTCTSSWLLFSFGLFDSIFLFTITSSFTLVASFLPFGGVFLLLIWLGGVANGFVLTNVDESAP